MKTNDLFFCINHFFSLYEHNSAAVSLQKKLRAASKRILSAEDVINAIDTVKALYEDSLNIIEHDIVSSGFNQRLLDLQRSIFRELEHVLSIAHRDARHRMMIMIPVADRPALLSNCLESIKDQCRIFQYGGTSVDEKGRRRYNKVSVFIFDDSKELSSRNHIQALSSELNTFGIQTHYIGPDDQRTLLQQIPRELRKDVFRVIGYDHDSDPSHKGASVTRNIAYLYAHSVMQKSGEKALLYFIDSDETFGIAARHGNTVQHIPFINYFYRIDVLFDAMDIDILTGKVVGDPPVSPAVMINTFLEDLLSFFERISVLKECDRCAFHEAMPSHAFSADYHDMATLFGYQEKAAPEKYICSLTGEHSVRDAVTDFASRVTDFFYGLHPTRTQFYHYSGDAADVKQARTVYTGNYVLNINGLRHFIPFARLNLRMAGPVLGRILKKQITDRFTSANLPLMHTRVLSDSTMHEFRSGVFKNKESLDLSDEFFRQFWGDVMLFSIESLTASGFPDKTLSADFISSVVSAVQKKFFHFYKEKRKTTIERNRKLTHYLTDDRYWWNRDTAMHDTMNKFQRFCRLVDTNFGIESRHLEAISDQVSKGTWTNNITHAIYGFYRDTELWNIVLNTHRPVKCSSPQNGEWTPPESSRG